MPRRPGSVHRWRQVAFGVALLAGGDPLAAQQAISLAEFEGWKSWPLYEPGDIELHNEALGTQVTEFDFEVPSGDTMSMRVDVFADVFFKGEPAVWVQYTSSGVEGDSTGTTSLDAMIVNRETFRILFRVASTQGPRTWAGPYDVTLHRLERIVRVQVGDDGNVETGELEQVNNPYDFAAMPYLFPFMKLEEGRRFRLMNIGSVRDLTPRPVGILVKGRVPLPDADGREHEVWEVQLLSNSEQVLVSIYVTEEAPYFWGWHYRRVEDGRTVVRLTYRDHTEL